MSTLRTGSLYGEDGSKRSRSAPLREPGIYQNPEGDRWVGPLRGVTSQSERAVETLTGILVGAAHLLKTLNARWRIYSFYVPLLTVMVPGDL